MDDPLPVHLSVDILSFDQIHDYFLVVVNMILINMMMAIINLAFEEIKQNSQRYEL